MNELAYTVADPVVSEEEWRQLTAWLPEMLQSLLGSPPYNRQNRPPMEGRGVYLFTENGRHLYVGRTGITTRTRRAGTEPRTSFRMRFDQHTQAGNPPWSASFAMRLARIDAREAAVEIPPGGWWPTKDHHPDFNQLFTAAKLRVGDEMEMRVSPFDDDERGIRSLVAEAYAAAILQTPFNDFSPP